jgi:glycosyltransferase involved in cell wall biosynthesis
MRILQVVTDRDRRGAQVYAMDLEPGLRNLGCDVETVALSPGTHGDKLRIEALGTSRRSPSTLRALRRRATGFDVLIAHGSTTLFACAVALAGSRTPFVYRQISDPLFWAATPARRIRSKVFLGRAQRIVSLSETTADVVASHYDLPRDKIVVVPNAVPGARFGPISSAERTNARTALGVEAGAHVVISIGALVPEKGVDLTIASLAGRGAVQLLVAGDGPERVALEALAQQQLGEQARFLGPIDDPRSLYAAADMLLLPTRGGDSMPAVLIEAGLCGLAAITCPIGAISDVVIDRETGVLVAPDDLGSLQQAVEELLTDQELTQRLGAAARTHCSEHFTIEKTAPLWVHLLSEVVGGTAPWESEEGP